MYPQPCAGNTGAYLPCLGMLDDLGKCSLAEALMDPTHQNTLLISSLLFFYDFPYLQIGAIRGDLGPITSTISGPTLPLRASPAATPCLWYEVGASLSTTTHAQS